MKLQKIITKYFFAAKIIYVVQNITKFVYLKRKGLRECLKIQSKMRNISCC